MLCQYFKSSALAAGTALANEDAFIDREGEGLLIVILSAAAEGAKKRDNLLLYAWNLGAYLIGLQIFVCKLNQLLFGGIEFCHWSAP